MSEFQIDGKHMVATCMKCEGDNISYDQEKHQFICPTCPNANIKLEQAYFHWIGASDPDKDHYNVILLSNIVDCLAFMKQIVEPFGGHAWASKPKKKKQKAS